MKFIPNFFAGLPASVVLLPGGADTVGFDPEVPEESGALHVNITQVETGF